MCHMMILAHLLLHKPTSWRPWQRTWGKPPLRPACQPSRPAGTAWLLEAWPSVQVVSDSRLGCTAPGPRKWTAHRDHRNSPLEGKIKQNLKKRIKLNFYQMKDQKMGIKLDLVRWSPRLLIPWHMPAAGSEVVSALGPPAARERQHLPAAWWKLRALPPSPAHAAQPSCSPTICRKMETNTQSREVLNTNLGTFHWSSSDLLSTEIF